MTELQDADQPTTVCGLWVDPATLNDTRLQEVPAGDLVVRSAVLRASELLYVASGRRWAGGTCTRTVVVDVAGECRDLRALVGQRIRSYRARPVAIGLPDFPVTAVTSVARGEHTVPAEDYEVWDGARLHHTGNGWLPGRYTVTYEHGALPPAGGRAAAAVLAVELYLAATGGKGCRLPQRVSSISRQGVTVALLDPMEFLDKGRTGLPEVDQWLVNVNPSGARSRPRVWSPDTHQPVHTRT